MDGKEECRCVDPQVVVSLSLCVVFACAEGRERKGSTALQAMFSPSLSHPPRAVSSGRWVHRLLLGRGVLPRREHLPRWHPASSWGRHRRMGIGLTIFRVQWSAAVARACMLAKFAKLARGGPGANSLSKNSIPRPMSGEIQGRCTATQYSGADVQYICSLIVHGVL